MALPRQAPFQETSLVKQIIHVELALSLKCGKEDCMFWQQMYHVKNLQNFCLLEGVSLMCAHPLR